jgi:hypothetical protein
VAVFKRNGEGRMSRSRKGTKGPGYEYWSPRPGNDGFIGKEAKKRTHRAERRQRHIEGREATPPHAGLGS